MLSGIVVPAAIRWLLPCQRSVLYRRRCGYPLNQIGDVAAPNLLNLQSHVNELSYFYKPMSIVVSSYMPSMIVPD